jgi:hypothetical protein
MILYAATADDDDNNTTTMTALPSLQTRRTTSANTIKNITINLYSGGKDNNDQQ